MGEKKIRHNQTSSNYSPHIFEVCSFLEVSKVQFLSNVYHRKKYVIKALPLQSCPVQGSVSTLGPTHCLPPFLGGGLLHLLTRDLKPFPHPLLQPLQSDQPLYSPCTECHRKHSMIQILDPLFAPKFVFFLEQAT